MRIKYIGQDQRLRVAKVHRVKFLGEGFRTGDKKSEWDEDTATSLIVCHLVHRQTGGKLLTLKPPEGFDMKTAENHLLENGWLDLSACTTGIESIY